MIKNFFNLNHPFWKMMNWLSSFMLMSLIWLLFTLPIITIGPSTVALLKVAQCLIIDGDVNVISDFVKYFRLNFKSSFLVGILTVLILTIFFADIWYYQQFNHSLSIILFFSSFFLAMIVLGFFLYYYPLISISTISKKNAVKFAFYLQFKHIGWTIFLVTMLLVSLFIIVIMAPYLLLFIIGAYGVLNMKIFMMLYDEEKFKEP